MKDMLIFIEGTDCNFKSTIAAILSEELNYSVTKGSSFELASKGNKELYVHFRAIADLEKGIVDRYIYSNLVYASKYRDFSIINNTQKVHLESLLKDKSVVLYLFASDEVVQQRIEQRGDEYINTKDISELNKSYSKVMESSGMTVLSFDTSKNSSIEIAESVLKWLKRT
ncbi:Thymidylate kinase [Terribacillus aidingensis]|uniref:Thymidylate kinase n=1 Tax=Terribacillus aidingensis TaxID=586416 RepID=A0A285NKP6_9BACI|nr:deoxynucleoside kinase [Terribacillus aidingensis]SNZ10025.1 Thymidylate kinase [Terribacillus aidingensis]